MVDDCVFWVIYLFLQQEGSGSDFAEGFGVDQLYWTDLDRGNRQKSADKIDMVTDLEISQRLWIPVSRIVSH